MEDASIKLLKQMINRIYDIISIEPSPEITEKIPEAAGQKAQFTNENSTVHLCIPGIPLYSEDFSDMYTLGNPNGVKSKTALFSTLVDAIPATGSNRYEQTSKRVSSALQLLLRALILTVQKCQKKPERN